MSSSSAQVKVAWRDLMSALSLWTRDVMALLTYTCGRAFGRIAGLTKGELDRRYPPPKRASAKATPEPLAETSSQAKPTPLPSTPSQAKEPKAVPQTSPKKPQPLSASDSVVPPNIERAVASQLQASHKDRLTHDEMLSFLTAFGVGPNDAKGTLALLKTQTKRDYVLADDLAQIQTWIGKSWISAKRRTYRYFEITVREQFGLELNATLSPDLLSAELVKRGFNDATAADLASKLTAKEWQ